MSRSSVNVPQNFFDDKKNECDYVELKGYLEKKFEGAGIEKLKPESEKDVEIEAKDIQQKYKDKLIEKAKEFLADRIEIQITIKDTSDISDGWLKAKLNLWSIEECIKRLKCEGNVNLGSGDF